MKAIQTMTLKISLGVLMAIGLSNFLVSSQAQVNKSVTVFPPIPPSPSPTPLPAEQIKTKYLSTGGATGFLGTATSAITRTSDGAGYYQNYQYGSIYWTRATGVHETHGEIWRKYNALGGPAALGYPNTDELTGPNGGRYNDYKKAGAIGSIYWKTSTGAHVIYSGIRDKYLSLGGPLKLGYPTTDETSPRVNTDVRYCDFEWGTSIYCKAGIGAYEIHGDIKLKYLSYGGADGFLGAPTTDESITPDSVGRYNHFESGSIYWSPRTGAHEIHGLIRSKWAELGWERSWLGYPLTDETVINGFAVAGGYGSYNKFQHGDVYYYPDSGAIEVRDLAQIFGSGQESDNFHRSKSKRKLLTIIYDTRTSPRDINSNDSRTAPMTLPTGLEIEGLLYGTQSGVPILGNPKSNVNDFYRENSAGKLSLENAGIIECVAPAQKSGKHYWNDAAHKINNNDGWLNGHQERAADAIRCASLSFDFKKYDENNNGKLTPDELMIAVVCGRADDDWGDVVPVYGGYHINYTWGSWSTYELKVDGVTISNPDNSEIIEWFAHQPTSTNPLSLGLPAHELGHLLSGAPDLYRVGWQYDAGVFSRMGAGCSACEITHHDPFYKLKAGWLNYTVALGNGQYTLRNVEEYGEALILYNSDRGRDEYFILEYRRPGTSYDAGRGGAGGGLPNAGIAVWHVVEDSSLQKRLKPPSGANNWYRKGVLLVRANGGFPVDDSKALFSTATAPMVLRWSDGSIAGFDITPLDVTSGVNPPFAVRLAINVTH